MATFTVYARQLEKPTLRFDYAIPTSRAKSARTGMLKYGPYDKNLFQGAIKAAIISPAIYEAKVKTLIRYLKEGIEGYPGFKQEFRADLNLVSYRLKSVTRKDYEEACKKIVRDSFDLVFVVAERKPALGDLYSHIKTRLLGNGIPSQFIDIDTLLSPPSQQRWIVENIALASYAKVGGTPWVIEAPEDRDEVVIGMSRALDPTHKVIVGFTTVFKHNGDFILSHSRSPVTTWEEYETGLERLVREAIEEYSRRESTPQSLVFHFHKRTGHREIESVKRALQDLGRNVKYALLHVNSYSNYRLFDTSHPTFVPLTGLMVRLGSRNALLLSSGRVEGYGRTMIGTPRVLHIIMDKNSTMDFGEFPRLVTQLYHFAYINWRGFNARTVPVTINYSQLISRLVANLESIEAWNEIVASGRLVDKAWFL